MEQAKQLTRRGYEKLLAEHEELSKVERPKVVKGVADAAAEGDRSENAEYIYGKKRLREIDKRLAYLSGLLKDVKVVDPTQLSGDRVIFGATVTIEDEEGRQKTWSIVGEGEADTREGTISYRSPMARALLGKQIGDCVTVERPAGDMDVEILGIRFVEPGQGTP